MEGVWEEGVGCGIGCWICGSGVLGSVVGDEKIMICIIINARKTHACVCSVAKTHEK